MLRRSSVLPALAAFAALSFSFVSTARAGQERVVVGAGGNSFTPSTITVNAGDHVIWFWQTGGHTVTSGNPNAPTPTGDGLFRSSTSGIAASSRFSWKSTAVGSYSYYCLPHAPGMAGIVNVVASSADVADFRITEVEFAGAGGADRVQVSNLGTDGGFIDFFRMSWVSATTQTITNTSVFVGAGSAITLHFNASGTNNATNLFFPAMPELGTQGSFALYVPNSTSTGSSAPAALTDPDQIVDYVEWGTPGQAAMPNRTTAVSASFWTAGDAVNTDALLPGGGAGYSISFCGARNEHGASFWQISTPNFGTAARCVTPVKSPTWGRIKALYR